MKKLEIEIDLKNKDDFISRYNDKTLDPKLRDYIINELVGYDNNIKLSINIKTTYKLTDDDKVEYRKIIRKEFSEGLIELEGTRKRSNIKRLSLFLIGSLSLLVEFKFEKYVGSVLGEIINILGWVCLWEFIYSILFTAISRKNTIKRYKQILNAEIKFL